MNTALINLTDTMLKKSIIDANRSVCEFAKTFSFDYKEAECGDRQAFEGILPRWHPSKGDLLPCQDQRGQAHLDHQAEEVCEGWRQRDASSILMMGRELKFLLMSQIDE